MKYKTSSGSPLERILPQTHRCEAGSHILRTPICIMEKALGYVPDLKKCLVVRGLRIQNGSKLERAGRFLMEHTVQYRTVRSLCDIPHWLGQRQHVHQAPLKCLLTAIDPLLAQQLLFNRAQLKINVAVTLHEDRATLRKCRGWGYRAMR